MVKQIVAALALAAAMEGGMITEVRCGSRTPDRPVTVVEHPNYCSILAVREQTILGQSAVGRSEGSVGLYDDTFTLDLITPPWPKMFSEQHTLDWNSRERCMSRSLRF